MAKLITFAALAAFNTAGAVINGLVGGSVGITLTLLVVGIFIQLSLLAMAFSDAQGDG